MSAMLISTNSFDWYFVLLDVGVCMTCAARSWTHGEHDLDPKYGHGFVNL
jgi:hypothetical protein